MFDIGFWELSIIGVVALIVIGPERLPGVARTVGLWTGKVKRVVGDMKSEIDKELKADELKKILQEQADSAGIHDIIEEGKSALEDVNSEISEGENKIQTDLNSSLDEMNTENADADERYGQVDQDDLLEEAGLLGAEEDDDVSEQSNMDAGASDNSDATETDTSSAEKIG